MEGRMFGDVPMNMELRLSVEDIAQLGRSGGRCHSVPESWRLTGMKGVFLLPRLHFLMKHPPGSGHR